jgi:hypothetical protein
MLKLSFLQLASSTVIAIIMFFMIIACYLLGHWLRVKGIKKNPEKSAAELSAINGTLLGLLGLLLAFTFSMASSRFDTRRALIIEEANDISTVILRTEMYPDSVRQLLRDNLKKYVEARIAFYHAGMEVSEIIHYYLSADSLSGKIWSIAANYAKVDDVTTRTSQLMPALNAMIDITTTRRAAGESTIPDSIMYFLFLLCICSAFLLGYDNKNKIDWIVVMGLAIMLSATVFNIIDLDRPRSGLINMDQPNEKITELLKMFNEQ